MEDTVKELGRKYERNQERDKKVLGRNWEENRNKIGGCYERNQEYGIGIPSPFIENFLLIERLNYQTSFVN